MDKHLLKTDIDKNDGKVSGDTMVPNLSAGELFSTLYFNGKVIGHPVKKEFVPRDQLPVIRDSKIVPSSYHAQFRMRSSSGVVISGVFDSTVEPAPSVKYPGGYVYPRMRTHFRFHGTISKPSLLHLNNKTFTMTRTLYDVVGDPGGP